MTVCIGFSVAVSGRKLPGGEGDAAEHFAGILGAAARGVAAFLCGDAVIHHGDHKLCVPFQPDQRELSQRDEQAALLAA